MKLRMIPNVFLVGTLVLLTLNLGDAFAFGPQKMSQDGDKQSSAESTESSVNKHMLISLQPVAKVNGSEIVVNDLMEKMYEIQNSKYRNQSIPSSLAFEIRKEAMDYLVAEKIIQLHAQKYNVNIPPKEIDARIEEIKNGLQDDKHYKMYLAKRGLSEQGLRDDVALRIATDRAITKEIDETIVIDRNEVEAIYKESKEQFIKPEKVQITDLIFFLDPKLPESREKVLEVQRDAKMHYSNDISKMPQDGSFAIREQLKVNKLFEPQLYEEAKKLKPSEISGVITANDTLHLVQLTGYEPEQTDSKESIIATIEKQMRTQMRSRKLAEWFAALKKDAVIEYIDVMTDK